MNRENMQIRGFPSEMTVRDGDDLVIEGYFAVFNSVYDMGGGMTETIAPGAFAETLSGDVRALINHDTTLVMGRTAAHTLELREDSRGLWGRIKVNRDDRDAMNLYARVKRGDVDQCSIGFDILDESHELRDDGSVHWTIRKVKLYEVTCCTFPAYEQTSISARTRDRDEIKRRAAEKRRGEIMQILKGTSAKGV